MKITKNKIKIETKKDMDYFCNQMSCFCCNLLKEDDYKKCKYFKRKVELKEEVGRSK